jgi:hypothetical protein
MQTRTQWVGDFDFRTVVGTFKQKLAVQMPYQHLHGLPLQSQYLYGGLRSKDGVLFVVERKFIGPMTGGLWLMSNEKGNLDLIPGSLHSARGELVRKFSPERRQWSDHLMHKVGKELAPVGEQGLDITIDDETIKWSEGELLTLEGQRRTDGCNFFAPMREEPLLYTSTVYWLKGTMMGKDVEGPIFFDHLYWQHGIEWKEYTWYKDIQVGWNVFANEFDDGSFEWGQIVHGRGGYAAYIVQDTKYGTCMTNVQGAQFELDADDGVGKASYRIDQNTWDFTGDKDGRMLQFNKARWGGYRAQGGITRRRGDSRKLVNGWTWLECFADRILSEGLVRK